jgi:rare lipoprotein A
MLKKYLLIGPVLILLFIFLRLYLISLGIKGLYPVTGLATWYNPRNTASGERYRSGEFTCAMRRRNFGREYLVCNLANSKCIAVRHNDFGPSLYLFLEGRIIDLSRSAFSKIANPKIGVIKVRVGEIYPSNSD